MKNLNTYLREKLVQAKRQKVTEFEKKTELNEKMLKTEQKIHQLRKERHSTDWNCEEALCQNNKIEDLNHKLKDDLAKVQKHLISLQKTSTVLKDSLHEFESISGRIARLVTH